MDIDMIIDALGISLVLAIVIVVFIAAVIYAVIKRKKGYHPENGIPEMVGRIGNQTAVANNGQIEEGIARATERGSEGTIRALYAVAAQLVRAIEDNTMTVNIGDDEIGRANDRYTARRGTNTTKGAFANAW